MSRSYGWLLLILLAGACLRIASLTEIPPGLTHDEADHGQDAWGVVNGTRPIYFTVGYGREPLYDYSTAGLMAFLGPTFLAGRLTAAFFSLSLIAATYAWVRRSFNSQLALFAAAGIAVSFWAVMTGRHGLRSITLPAIFALAAIFYWRAIGRDQYFPSPASEKLLSTITHRPVFNFIVAGIFLGVTFYTYIPARIMWFLFPIMLLYLLVTDRAWASKVWRGTLLMLLAAGLLALPLILYLMTNPGVEIRLDELSQPLAAAGRGDFKPLVDNIFSGLGALILRGDGQWRYNLPGRPLLSPLMAVLFVVGLGIALWRITLSILRRYPAVVGASAFFALAWLVIGLVPVLITGVEFSTPRAVAIQPVLFVFPALSLELVTKLKPGNRWLATVVIMLVFTLLFAQTIRQYFYIWAQEPEVRVQYETSLVSVLSYLDDFEDQMAAVSTTTPELFHSPAVALLVSERESSSFRWFNGLHSLLVPGASSSQLVFSGFAPLNPYLERYFTPSAYEEIPTQPGDIDQPLLVFRADAALFMEGWQEQFSESFQIESGRDGPIQFGEAAELLGYDLQTDQLAPGGEVRLATLWRVGDPLEGAVLFTQVLGADGFPVAQADRLDAPGSSWNDGDFLIQLHQFELPEDIAPGEYPIIVGIYTRPDLVRIPVIEDGEARGDHVQLMTLTVRQ